jgi:hypothetical protein
MVTRFSRRALFQLFHILKCIPVLINQIANVHHISLLLECTWSGFNSPDAKEPHISALSKHDKTVEEVPQDFL